MNITRKQRQQLSRENAKRPDTLTKIPRDQWPESSDATRRNVWLNKEFMVQEFAEDHAIRLSVNRTTMLPNGRWLDRIEWDELQRIKRAVGYGNVYAVEIYPRDVDVVNDANMRHLWLLTKPLPIGWFNVSKPINTPS